MTKQAPMMLSLHSLCRNDMHAAKVSEILFPVNNQPCEVINANERDDAFNNCTPIHVAASNNSINIANLLIRHAQELDYTNTSTGKNGTTTNRLTDELLTAQDRESGYTPLHRAFLARDLKMAWLLIRSNIRRSENALDHEGLSAFDLLGKVMRKELKECRLSLRPDVRVPYRIRADSVLDDDEDYSDANSISRSDFHIQSNNNGYDCGSSACEVLTFGRANHFALGVPKFSHDALPNKPRRVDVFAVGMSRVEECGPAISIAAAAYHTLVLTQNGHLYTFGFGKGGRLGTGDDKHCPLPVRIMGPFAQRKITSVSAAENHSLAATRDGKVYAWGSNRFGQLGYNSNSVGKDDRFIPRKVDELKRMFVVKVASGLRHSVVLCEDGKVFTFGDNSSGQLGIVGSSPGNGKVYRVNALWDAVPSRKGIEIAAGEHSTLVLTKPSGQTLLPINTLYEWGHGISTPSKVSFPCLPSDQHNVRRQFSRYVNPVAISAGKHHNVVLTEDGKVYSWGFHLETLGTKKQSVSGRAIGAPQLVSALSSEFAVAVSASDDHTAVVTETGDLFTFGVSEKEVLGHEGIRWQLSPKKVTGVQRVVSVAAAREHTVLLAATSFPKPSEQLRCVLNSHTVPSDEVVPEKAVERSLQQLCAQQIAQRLDLYNGVLLFANAEKIYCSDLSQFCEDFLKMNMDSILCSYKKRDLDILLENSFDDQYINIRNNSLPIAKHIASSSGEDVHDNLTYESKSSRLALSLNMETADSVVLCSNHTAVSKEIRGLRKKMKSIAQLEVSLDKAGKDPTVDQREKLRRRVNIENDIKILVPLRAKLEQRMLHFNISKTDQLKSEIPKQRRFGDNESEVKNDGICQIIEEQKLDIAHRCEACNVTCPDANTLALHLAGKRHRNRLKRMEENDCEATLQALGRHQSGKIEQQRVANSTMNSPRWGNSLNKESSRTFQEILAEEERAAEKKPASPLKQSKTVHLVSPVIKSKYNNASPTKISRPSILAVASSCDKTSSSFLLSDLLEKQKQPKVKGSKKIMTDHPWGKKERSNSVSEGFQNILRDEENRKEHEDTRGVSESKWFLEQRERASSFSALLKADKEERELQRLIEEQRLIEAQIKADIAQKKKELELANASQSRPKRKQRKDKNRRNRDEKKSSRNKQTKSVSISRLNVKC